MVFAPVARPEDRRSALAPLSDIAEFQRQSTVRKAVQRALHAYVMHQVEPEMRPVYETHFAEASRNVEIAVDHMGQMFLRRPGHALCVVEAVADFIRRYYPAMKHGVERERWLIYTEHDHRVPFVAESDILYVYMAAQLGYVAHALATRLPLRAMHKMSRGFMEMNTLAIEAFEAHPTTMPRWDGRHRISLRILHAIDEPTNCAPSLHIAYALYLDNVTRHVLGGEPRYHSVCAAVRCATRGMFNSVLYTKQHAVLDVAFGMLVGRRVFLRRFGGSYDDLRDEFPALMREHAIPFDAIAEMYAELLEREEGGRRPIAEVLGEYLRDHGYPRLPAGTPVGHQYFHTRTRETVPFQVN